MKTRLFQNIFLGRFLWQIVLGIVFIPSAFGQIIPSYSLSDTSVLSVQVRDFIQVNDLLPTHLSASNTPFQELQSTFEQLKKPEIPQTHVGLNQYFFWGDTLDNNAISTNFYSQLYANTKVQLGQLPLQLGGQLVAIDGQLDLRLSSLTFGFDAAEWQQNLREKYLLPDDWLEAQKALNLTPEELQALEEQFQFDIYQQILAHPHFAGLKATAQHKVDSLVAVQADSLALEKWQKTATIIQNIEQTYQRLWDIRQKVSPYTTLKGIEEKTQQLKSRWLSLANPDTVHQKLLSNDQLKLQEKWLTLTKDFEIGQFGLHDSEYTAQYLPLNGVHYSFSGKQLYGEMGWGNQALNSNFLPTLSSLLISRYHGQRFFFLKAGIGEEENSYGSIGLLRAKTYSKMEDSTFVLPKENLVIATSGATDLSNHIKLETDIALSQHDIIQLAPIDATTDISSSERLAFKLRSLYQTKRKRLSFGIGYFHVGNAFKTLGNPFLLTGRQGLRLDIKTWLWKRKLAINLSGKYGWNTNSEVVTNDFKHLQLRGEVRWKLGKQNQILLRFMPNTFQQYQSEQIAAAAQNTIYSAQGIFFHSLGKHQLSTIIHLTNLDSNFRLADTLTTGNQLYLYIQEGLQLTETKSIQATLLLGGENPCMINNFLAQLDYHFRLGKANITGGGQILQSPFEETILYGLLLQMNVPVLKQGTLQLQATWRQNWTLDQPIQQLFGNLSFTMAL